MKDIPEDFKKIGRPIFHDLDHLAGTWSASEAKEFNKNTEFFEKIDSELWTDNIFK